MKKENKPHPIHGYSDVRQGNLKTQGTIENEKDKLQEAKEVQEVKDLIDPPKESDMFKE